MGLDMYAFTLDRAPAEPVDFKADEFCHFHYWRKHPNLHGWMEQLYRDKGGAAPEFNCAHVQLTTRDLDALEDAIRTGSLPPTRGFFFGESDGSEAEDDLAFIAEARSHIAAGLAVCYSSWW